MFASDEPVLEEISEVIDTSSVSSLQWRQKNGSQQLHHSFSPNSTAQDSLLREVVLELDEEDDGNDEEEEEEVTQQVTAVAERIPSRCKRVQEVGDSPGRGRNETEVDAAWPLHSDTANDDDTARNWRQAIMTHSVGQNGVLRASADSRSRSSVQRATSSEDTSSVMEQTPLPRRPLSTGPTPMAYSRALQATRVIFPVSSHDSTGSASEDEDHLGADAEHMRHDRAAIGQRKELNARAAEATQEREGSEARAIHHQGVAEQSFRNAGRGLASTASRQQSHLGQAWGQGPSATIMMCRERESADRVVNAEDEMEIVPKFKDLFGHAMKALAKPSSLRSHLISTTATTTAAVPPTYAATPVSRQRQLQRSTSPPAPSALSAAVHSSSGAQYKDPAVDILHSEPSAPTSLTANASSGKLLRKPLVYGWRHSTATEKPPEAPDPVAEKRSQHISPSATLGPAHSRSVEASPLPVTRPSQKPLNTRTAKTTTMAARAALSPAVSSEAPAACTQVVPSETIPPQQRNTLITRKAAARRSPSSYPSHSPSKRSEPEKTVHNPIGHGCTCFAQVEVDPETLIVVRIRPGDDTADLATRFIQEHHLKASVHPVLKAHFDQQRAAKAGGSTSRPDASAPSATIDANTKSAPQRRAAPLLTPPAKAETNPSANNTTTEFPGTTVRATRTTLLREAQRQREAEKARVEAQRQAALERPRQQWSRAPSRDRQPSRRQSSRGGANQEDGKEEEQTRQRRQVPAPGPLLTSEEREVLEHCTFQPHINTTTAQQLPHSRSSTTANDRLSSASSIQSGQQKSQTRSRTRSKSRGSPASNRGEQSIASRHRGAAPPPPPSSSSTSAVVETNYPHRLTVHGRHRPHTTLTLKARLAQGAQEDVVAERESGIDHHPITTLATGRASVSREQGAVTLDSRSGSTVRSNSGSGLLTGKNSYPVVIVASTERIPSSESQMGLPVEGRNRSSSSSQNKEWWSQATTVLRRSWREASLAPLSSLSVDEWKQQQQQRAGWSGKNHVVRQAEWSVALREDEHYSYHPTTSSCRSYSSSYTNPFSGR